MKDMKRRVVILACVATALCFATDLCFTTGLAHAAAKPVAQDTQGDDMPTVFISGTSSSQMRAAQPPKSTRKKPDTARVAPKPATPKPVTPKAAVPAAPQAVPQSVPRPDFARALNIPVPAPRPGGIPAALPSTAEPPPAAVHFSVRPRLLFDARRSALPASWLQVDPANQVPLMRQAVGVDSEYVRRLVGVEVGYSASGAAEPSRFLFDVRTNSLDQETVRAAVGIPLN
jgi:hypothetical protein